jgi:hypothetical protein
MDDIYLNMTLPELQRFMATREYMMLPAHRREYIQKLEYAKKNKSVPLRSSAEAGFPKPTVQTQMQERAGIREAQQPAIKPTPSAEDLLSGAFNPMIAPPQEIKTPTPSPAAATPTAAPMKETAPDFFQSIRDKLFQGGGGGKMPSIPRVDSKEITKNIPQISERKPEETYKADPYMTMLQTGLRILSAKPEIGQSAISQIAGGVGAGVADYRAEKEKEKQSKREEAREARAEEYRRAEAARSTAGLDMQVATLNQNAAIAEARMRQEAAQHGQSADLRRLELAVNIEDKKADNLLRKQIAAQSDPNEIIKMAKPFEDRLEALRKEFQETKDPMRREVLKGQIDRTERDITTIRRFSVAREGASDERNKYQLLGRLRGELTKLQGMPMADPSAVQNTMQQIRRLEDELGIPSTVAPASLPSPVR